MDLILDIVLLGLFLFGYKIFEIFLLFLYLWSNQNQTTIKQRDVSPCGQYEQNSIENGIFWADVGNDL
jgi:hypothetical protein